MKGIVKIAATVMATMAAVALLAVAASAGAATRTLVGTFKDDADSSVSMRVKHAHGEWFVRGFSADEIPISCAELTEARLSTTAIAGLAPIDDAGKFKLSGVEGQTEVRVAGRLLSKHSARGRFRYLGPTEVDGETLDCDSGALKWTAARE